MRLGTKEELISQLVNFYHDLKVSDRISCNYIASAAHAFYETGQFRIFDGGFVTWAYLTPQDEISFATDNLIFYPENICPGPDKTLWVIEVLAPDKLRGHIKFFTRLVYPHRKAFFLLWNNKICDLKSIKLPDLTN